MLEIGALFIILAVLGLGAMFLGITVSVVQHLIAGLVVGALARLVIPGRENIGLLGTALFGVAGGLLGGFFGNFSEPVAGSSSCSPSAAPPRYWSRRAALSVAPSDRGVSRTNFPSTTNSNLGGGREIVDGDREMKAMGHRRHITPPRAARRTIRG